MTVRIFVEGGGDKDLTRTACRRAFVQFFKKALGAGPQPRVEPCGSRDEAHKDFCRFLQQDRDTCSILLVDSEDAVADDATPWQHLQRRDKWTTPVRVPSDQVHLMVQCMEAWFLADRRILIDYYRHNFNANALPGNPNPEQIPKRDVMSHLSQATRETTKDT